MPRGGNRLKTTHNAATTPDEPNGADSGSMDLYVQSSAGALPPDAGNVGPKRSATLTSIFKPKSVLDDVALIGKNRLQIYHHMLTIESTHCLFNQDHLGRFVCPVDSTGLTPFLNHAITTISGLRQEYLAEVFKRVVFKFTSSESLKLFSDFFRAHFNLNKAQVPHVRIKTFILHPDSFPQGVSQIVSLSTAVTVEFRLCHPWRNFIDLKGVTAPLRRSGIDLHCTFYEPN
ncbi:hypothetical protein EDB82DRAFT_528189 [Fusarium venenatum]|uniref:uncharacterized protein n=1 Tax=Fusarium venenatum TaxID=56646 RepID=UPI001D769014|nr:hypothetical protein EDB82DRAFT_528189 [Fusarium venenatum]